MRDGNPSSGRRLIRTLPCLIAGCLIVSIFVCGGCENDKICNLPTCYDPAVGRAMSVEWSSTGNDHRQFFEWYEYFGNHKLAVTDVLSLSFAVVPFPEDSSSGTSVGLGMNGGMTLLSLSFRDGMVEEFLPYKQNEWNCIEVRLDCSEQAYVIEVNGRHAGPFPIDAPSMSVGSFHVSYLSDPLTATAANPRTCWLDAISLKRFGGSRAVTLYEEGCCEGKSFELLHGVIISDSPLED